MELTVGPSTPSFLRPNADFTAQGHSTVRKQQYHQRPYEMVSRETRLLSATPVAVSFFCLKVGSLGGTRRMA